MATIIQPYNSWREQLAANILGPIIGNMIQRSQQNADNRKYNAMLGELATQSMNQNQTQQGSPSLMAGFQNTQPANGWENAFRGAGSPLANFDANTAITPSVTPNNYNQADNMSRLMQLLASPRFSHLSTQEAFNRANPYLQALQAQRLTDLRNQYATGLGNAGSFDEQMNLLARAVMEGAASDDTLKTMAGYAEHRQPHMTFAEMNAGDRVFRLAQNPATGQVLPGFSSPVGVSPNTQATLAMQKYGYDVNANLEQQRINNAQINADRNYGLADRAQTEAETQGQYNREHPELKTLPSQSGVIYIFNNRTGELVEARTPDGKVIKDPITLRALQQNTRLAQDKDGNYIVIDTVEATARPVTTPNGTQATGQPKNTPRTPNPNQDLTKSQELKYKGLDDEAKELRKERSKYVNKLTAFDPSDPEYSTINNEIARIDKRLGEIEKEKQAITNPSQTQAAPSITPTAPEDNNYTGWVNEKTNEFAPREWEERADRGEFKQWGINNKEDMYARLEQKGFKKTNKRPQKAPKQTPKTPATSQDIKPPVTTPASPDVKPTPPTSNDIPPQVTPSPVSPDMEHTTPQTSSNVTSADNAPSVTPAPVESQDVKPKTPISKKGKRVERFNLGDLPPEAIYNPERDKNIKPENILTPQQFGALIVKIMNKNPTTAKLLQPSVIGYRLIKNGIRIKIS